MTSAAVFNNYWFLTRISLIDWTGVGLPEVAPCQNYINQQLDQSYHWRENHLEWRHLTYKEHLCYFHWTDSQFRPGPCTERWKRCWLWYSSGFDGGPAALAFWCFPTNACKRVDGCRRGTRALRNKKTWFSNPGFHLNTNTFTAYFNTEIYG